MRDKGGVTTVKIERGQAIGLWCDAIFQAGNFLETFGGVGVLLRSGGRTTLQKDTESYKVSFLSLCFQKKI